MTTPKDDDYSLHAEVFPCPHCGKSLFRIDRAMADDWHFYCDQCPNWVEVSVYDEGINLIRYQSLRENGTDPDSQQLLRMIEARLRPCDCGGLYKFDAPRRCPFCQEIAISDSPAGVDLKPGFMRNQVRTLEQKAQVEAYFAQRMRRSKIWRRSRYGTIIQSGESS